MVVEVTSGSYKGSCMKTYTTEFQLMSQCKAGLADKSCMLIMVHAFHCTLYVMYKMQLFALLTKVIEHLLSTIYIPPSGTI